MIANPQSIKRLGHFLTTDCKSVETPNGVFLSSVRRPGGFEIPSPVRRPDGFEIRRKKKVRPMKPGDL